MRIGGIGAALALGLLALPRAAWAGDPDLLAAAIGVYDVLHPHRATQLRVEYRWGYQLFYIAPLAGVLGTVDGSFYAYGGLRADLIVAHHFIIMPVAAVGYWQRGGGKNLGSHAEFKTGGEVAYRFDDGSRLGLAFDHISNAGLAKTNPGVESLLLVYSLPLR